MNVPGDRAALLRPLTLGEIFDRAITLYVRNAVAFTLIVLVLVAPSAVLQYFASLHASATFTQLFAAIQNPRSVPTPADTGMDSLFAFGNLALSVVLGAFVAVALACAIGRLYRQEEIEWLPCYLRALRRVPGILMALLCELVVVFFAVFGGAIAMGLAFGLGIVLVRTSVPLSIVAFVFAAVVMLLWVLGIVLCYLAFAFAYNAIGVENSGVWAAMGSGFARIFNRGEILRACLISLALIAIYLGLSILELSVAATFEAMRLHLANVALTALVQLVSYSFLGILLAVYYFDVRVRREGLDMQEQIEHLRSAPSPT